MKHERNDPILITGASGILGWHLCRYFAAQGFPVQGTYCRNQPKLPGVRFHQLQLESTQAVRNLVQSLSCRAVIHAAGMTHPDECEQAQERCSRVNVSGTAALLEDLPPAVRFIYISTDLVFDGQKGGYSEEDVPYPPNHYACTKQEAEKRVGQRAGAVVVRMAKLYGPDSPFYESFETWMQVRFERREKLLLFSDQYRSLIYVGDVARALEQLLEHQPRHHLYHLGGPERLSRSRFGEIYAGVCGYEESLISPISSKEIEKAPRGKDCSLDSSRLTKEFNFQPYSAREGLERMRQGVY